LSFFLFVGSWGKVKEGATSFSTLPPLTADCESAVDVELEEEGIFSTE
jgi:hypothetical protein